MAGKIEAYVDTSALIAFADRSDTYHLVFRRAFADPPRLVTTPLVVAEGHGWFLRRFDSHRALQFLAMVEAIEPLVVVALTLYAGFQTHARIGVILQRVHQNLADIRFIGRLRQQVHRVHSYPGVVVVACREKQKLLDALVVQRALRFLRGNRVVLDTDLTGSRFLGDGTDTGDGSFERGCAGSGCSARKIGCR